MSYLLSIAGAAPVAALVVGLLSPQAHAACFTNEYDHNGSLMLAEFCDGNVVISYRDPRPGIRAEGVVEGTVLFDGTEQPNGQLDGWARIYSRTCGEAEYNVSGMNRGPNIELSGDAPVRDSRCRVTRYRSDFLAFTLIEEPEEVSCPPGTVLTDGFCDAIIAGTPALGDVSCDQWGGIRSENSDNPTHMTFVNMSGAFRFVMWLDFNGDPQEMGALNPGESISVDTFLTHPFMTTDGPGNCVEIYLPESFPRTVELQR